MTIVVSGSSKLWSDFFDWVMPHVPGCIQTVAEDAIREAAIEFCDQTLIYRRDVTLNVVAGGTGLYNLSAPTTAQYGDQIEPLSVQDGKYNGTRIHAKTDGELQLLYGDTWDTTVGVTRYFNMYDEFTARFAPIPDTAATGGLVLSVAMVPAEDATQFDDVMWKSYHIEISNAAVASLMMSPKKPYTNLKGGMERSAQFLKDCNTLAVHKKNNFTRKALRSTPQFR